MRRAFLLYYKEKKPLCGQKIQDWSFFFFSSYETLLFKQPEWIVSVHFFKVPSHSLGYGCPWLLKIWPFSAQGDKVPWPAVPECPIFIYCIHAHLLKMRYSRANIFQNRCHIYNIYTFVHTYLYSCDVQKFKKNVHIYYKIVTKTGQCFAHSGKMKLSNNTTLETRDCGNIFLLNSQIFILALSLAKLPFKNRRSKMKEADLAHLSKWNTRRIFT